VLACAATPQALCCARNQLLNHNTQQLSTFIEAPSTTLEGASINLVSFGVVGVVELKS
jgi:hypothetical protein